MATVLITSAGSGAGITVSRALRGNVPKDELTLWGADHHTLAPGLRFVDESYSTPRCEDPGFLNYLLGVLEKSSPANGAILIFPTFSKEIPVFAKNQQKLKNSGARILLASERSVEVCSNKTIFEKWCVSNGISTALNLNFEEGCYLLGQSQKDGRNIQRPLSQRIVVKPETGSGSSNVFFPKNEKELLACLTIVPQPLIQKYIPGIEVTVDVYCSADLSTIATCARERMVVKGGQMIIGKTVDDTPFRPTIEKITRALELLGPSNFQFRYPVENPQEPILLEVNPRFAAGGLALSIRSGLNTPLLLYKDLMGIPIQKRDLAYKRGVVMARYYDELFWDESEK